MNNRAYLGGIPIHTGAKAELAQEVCQWLFNGGKSRQVVTLNAVMLITALKNPMLNQAIKSADLTIADGYGIIYALRKRGLQAERFPGVELASQLLDFCARWRLPVYVYGGNFETVRKLEKVFSEKWPGLAVVAIKDGFEKGDDQIKEEVVRTKPRLILAGLGSPRQEIFLAKLLPDLKDTVGIGVGGALEIISGRRIRAPRIFRDNGWEWFYRMLQQPQKITNIPALVEFWYQFLK